MKIGAKFLAYTLLNLSVIGSPVFATEDILCEFDYIESKSTSGNFWLKIKDVHASITKEALDGQLSKDCLKLILASNRAQDHGSAGLVVSNHFDDNSICESTKQIELWENQILASKRDVKTQMQILGKIFHSVQDFYSHANYLEKTIENNQLDSNSFLPVMDLSFANCNNIKNDYFTANNHQVGLVESALVSMKHLEDPHSHLYLNKDFDPKVNKGYAKIYSRSSFMKINGKTYFEIINKTQVQHTKQIFQKILNTLGDVSQCK